MKYTWDKVTGSLKSGFAILDRTVNRSATKKEAMKWWNENLEKLPKGTYHLTEWNGNEGDVKQEIEIN